MLPYVFFGVMMGWRKKDVDELGMWEMSKLIELTLAFIKSFGEFALIRKMINMMGGLE